MNTQDWFRLEWTSWISLKSKGLSRVFSNTTVQKHQILRCSAFFTVQLSHLYMITGKTIALTRWTFVGKVMSLLLNMLSRLAITFLPKSKRLLISQLQSPSAVILGTPKRKHRTKTRMTPDYALLCQKQHKQEEWITTSLKYWDEKPPRFLDLANMRFKGKQKHFGNENAERIYHLADLPCKKCYRTSSGRKKMISGSTPRNEETSICK